MVEAAVIVALGKQVWAIIEGWNPLPGLHINYNPDLKQEGAPVRFSLRTLLVATTLIAVMLGLVVWSSS